MVLLQTSRKNQHRDAVQNRGLPWATSLAFALVIKPSKSAFQVNTHLAVITLTPFGTTLAENVPLSSCPVNSARIALRHTSAYFVRTSAQVWGALST